MPAEEWKAMDHPFPAEAPFDRMAIQPSQAPVFLIKGKNPAVGEAFQLHKGGARLNRKRKFTGAPHPREARLFLPSSEAFNPQWIVQFTMA